MPFKKKKVTIADTSGESQEMDNLPSTSSTNPRQRVGIGRSASMVPSQMSTGEELSPPWRRSSDADIVKMLTPKHSFIADISTPSFELNKDTHYYDERDYQLHRRENLHHHTAFGHHHRSTGKFPSRGESKASYLGETPSRKSLEDREPSARSLDSALQREEPVDVTDAVDGSKPMVRLESNTLYLYQSTDLPVDESTSSAMPLNPIYYDIDSIKTDTEDTEASSRQSNKFTLGGEPLDVETVYERDSDEEGWLPKVDKDSFVLRVDSDESEPEVVDKHTVHDKIIEEEEEEEEGEGERKKEPVPEMDKQKTTTVDIGDSQDEEQDEVPELGKIEKKSSPAKQKQKRKHHHRHRHRHHKHRYEQTPRIQVPEGVPEELRDEEMLIANQSAYILEDIQGHRLEDQPGVRRHLIRRVSSVMHPGRHAKHYQREEKPEPKKTSGLKLKKKFDHRPHEVFVELDELYTNTEGKMAWKEKARWIKFEEDVEEGADRWGKPHVASLSFHSLLELRKGMELGTLLLDLDQRDISGIAHQITEQMIIEDQIGEESRGDVLRALLMQHRHMNESQGILRSLSASSLPSMKVHQSDSRKALEKNFSMGVLRNNRAGSDAKIDIEGKVINHGDLTSPLLGASATPGRSSSNNNLEAATSQSNVPAHMVKPSNPNKHIPVKGIMRQIPQGAEATTVLVGTVDFLEAPCMAFARLAQGAMLDNFTEVPIPVRFIFVLLGPSDSAMDYTEIGRSISTLMADERFHKQAYEADCRDDLLDAINEFLDDSMVLPPGDWNRDTLLPIARMHKKKMKWKQMMRQKEEDESRESDSPSSERAAKSVDKIDPLKRTGCLFGGLVNDIKRRYPKYLSDFKDALSMQCLAALVFIYFAALSPAITFGGLLGEKTDRWMGVSEMIVGTAFCGVLFALLSGQPLLIIGATGPVLIFEEAVYVFCRDSDLEYLPFRAWVGIWVLVVTIFVVAFEGSTLVRFFTRFTEEIFTALVSLIFIYEVFKKLHKVYMRHPLLDDYCFEELLEDDYNSTNFSSLQYSLMSNNESSNYSIPTTMSSELDEDLRPKNEPNTALLSTILTFGTFFIAYFLRKFRNGRFFSNKVRKTLGDFGILIAIVIMASFDVAVKNVYTQKLEIPDGFTPTAPDKRGWFISPLGLQTPIPVWAVFGAAIPAILVFILLYMETLITELIVNKKVNNLKKGAGFHLDMFLIGILVCVSSLFGLPWACAATVRSVSHTASLTVMSKTHAPGEKPKIEGVIEQRVTALVVNMLIGISLAMQSVLRQIPIAVLFGVFLYMGVTAMSGIQFFERLQMLLMPAKHFPDTRFVRKVKKYRIHLFTVLQFGCLALLWVVKSTVAALAFPFVLILMVPIRFHVIGRIFTSKELEELDNDEAGDDDEGWDEYTIAPLPI
ncbi:band 3 anion transport protein-like [Glandiceps talaboti]